MTTPTSAFADIMEQDIRNRIDSVKDALVRRLDACADSLYTTRQSCRLFDVSFSCWQCRRIQRQRRWFLTLASLSSPWCLLRCFPVPPFCGVCVWGRWGGGGEGELDPLQRIATESMHWCHSTSVNAAVLHFIQSPANPNSADGLRTGSRLAGQHAGCKLRQWVGSGRSPTQRWPRQT